MRNASIILALTALTACESESLAGPAAASAARAVEAQRPADAPFVARLIVCRGGPAQSGPLYIVDGQIVNDSIAAIAFLKASKVEVVRSTEAAMLYGSRGSQGVVLITTARE